MAASGSNLARFLELRGRRTFERDGVIWGEHKCGFFSPLPMSRLVDLTLAEANEILRAERLPGLRVFSTSMPGAPSGMYVAHPSDYSLNSVCRKQRRNVAVGLDNCDVRAIDTDLLRAEGLQLNRDTLSRQGRSDGTFLDPARWSRFVTAVEQCPGMMVHGAFRLGRLASYLISIREGEWLFLLYKMSRAEDLEFRCNHALDYTVLRLASKLEGVRYVGNGAGSVLPNEGLDRYKRQMGYEFVEHRLCIHLHPAIAPLAASRAAISFAGALARRFPDRPKLAYRAAILQAARDSRACANEEIPAFGAGHGQAVAGSSR